MADGFAADAARRTCFAHALDVAAVMRVFSRRFDAMVVTGMQHAATAAIAIVEGISCEPRRKAEAFEQLQFLAETLSAHADYHPAKVMSDILRGVVADYRAEPPDIPWVDFAELDVLWDGILDTLQPMDAA
jgi:hypothetical protein